MIYVKNLMKLVEFPAYLRTSPICNVTILNNVTKKKQVFSDLTNVSNSDLLFSFENLDFSGLDEGEYTYTICDHNEKEVLSYGLLVVGDYQSSDSQYESSNKTVQYNG